MPFKTVTDRKIKLLVTNKMVEIQFNNKLINRQNNIINNKFMIDQVYSELFNTEDFDFSKVTLETVLVTSFVNVDDMRNILRTFYDLVSPDLTMSIALKECIDEYGLQPINENKDIKEFAYNEHLELLKNDSYKIFIQNWYNHPLLCLTFGFYESLLSDEQRSVLRAIADVLDIRWADYTIGYNRLKSLSTKIKKIGFRWRKDWSLFCDLHMLYGFNIGIKLSAEQKDEKILSWFTNKKVNISNYKNIRYESDFKTMLRSLVGVINIDKDKNIRQWADNPENWVSSGSSKKEVVKLIDRKDKIIVDSNNKKPAIALNTTTDGLLSRLLDKNTDEAYTIETKIEVGGKGRVICAAPATNNLRQDYLSYLFEKEFKIETAPLFMSNKNTFKMYHEGSQLLRAKTWSVPLDADKFDHNVYTSELNAIFDIFDEILKSNNRGDIDLEVMRLIRKDYFGKVRSQTGKITRLEHGLPSGIRWTSLMGCLISITRARLVEKIATEQFGVRKNKRIWTFGDDIQMFNDSLLSCVTQVYLFDALALPVNALKNIITNRFGEFLRNIITEEGNRGYAARKVCSILFYKPGYNENTKSELWNETFTNIWLLGNRLISHAKIEELLNYIIGSKYLSLEKAFGGIHGTGAYSGFIKEFKQQFPRYTLTSNDLGCYTTKFINSLKLADIDIDNVKEKLALMVTPKMHSQYLIKETVDEYVYGKMNRRNWDILPLVRIKFEYYSVDMNKYDNIFTDEVISYIVDNYKYEKAIELLFNIASDKCKNTFHLLRKHWTRRVNYLYVKGKLKWVFKSYPGFTDNFISVNFDDAINIAWSSNATRRVSLNDKMTQNDFKNLNQNAIIIMNRYLQKLVDAKLIY